MLTDSVHYATGDGTLAAIKHTMCIFFNSSLLSSNGIEEEEIYNNVAEGIWTVDLLSEYSEKLYSDVNGDGINNFGDSFGLTFGNNNKYFGFINSLGAKILEKKDGKFEITYDSERAVEAITKMCELVHNNKGVLRGLSNNENEEIISS